MGSTAAESLPLSPKPNTANESCGKRCCATFTKEGERFWSEIKQGEDGLGALVAAISRASGSSPVDRALHCLNATGFEWADSARSHLMVACWLIGATIFALFVIGSLGLSPNAMWMLPWATYTNLNVSTTTITWWYCAEHSTYSEGWNNCSAWMCEQPAIRDRLIGFGYCTAANIDDGSCPALHSSSEGDYWVGSIDFYLNQWGLCVGPSDPTGADRWIIDVWSTPSEFQHYKKSEYSDGGRELFCREWENLLFPEGYALPECENPSVSAMTLFMSVIFGGFIKLFEPIK